MNIVKRYTATEVRFSTQGGSFVLEADFVDSEAALREELAMSNGLLQASNESHMEWRKRLTAAEQRNADLHQELGDSKELVQVIAKRAATSELRNLKLIECLEDVCNTLYCQSSEGADALSRARAALKPTAPVQKICIECGQPYCLGVCVERGDEQEASE